MTLRSFIFSNKPLHRLARHLAFWEMYYFYSVLSSLPDVKLKTLFGAELYINAWQDALSFFPIYLFAVYVSVYFILPRYLAKRKKTFLFFSCFFLFVLTTAAAYFIAQHNCAVNDWHCTIWDIITNAQVKGIGEVLVIAGTAIIIKIMKDYAVRQRESETLALNNVRNGLRLLKGKMHPSILFGCLHAIYNDIDAGATYAPEMILKLSDLLSYLLYETESKQVVLAKETMMIRNYMELKRLEYKNSLDAHFEVVGELNEHYIVPGLFLPLLEIGIVPFENVDTILYVSVTLKMDNSQFYFKLKNNRNGVRLMNMAATQAALYSVKESLQLFYRNKFKIDVQPATDSFAIILKLKLDKIGSLEQPFQKSETPAHEHP